MSGKYTISSNCTGSTTLADSAGNSTALNFTVVSGGGEILFNETDSGVIISGSSQQQFAKAGILSQVASGGGCFRERLSNGTYAEGTAPLEDRNISDLLVPFDNTGGFVTGVALVNSTSVSTTIDVTIRDAFGNRLGSPSAIVLSANGHLAFVATTQFPMTKGQLGTIEFQPTSSGGIAGLGLRFSPFNSFTSVPVIVRR